MSHDTDKTSYPPVLCHACPNVRQEWAETSLRRFVQWWRTIKCALCDEQVPHVMRKG